MKKLNFLFLLLCVVISCKKNSTPTPPPPDTSIKYKITATTGPGGTIDPAGVNSVASGSNLTYTITPNASPSYGVLSLKVDNVAVIPVTNVYTFSNVESDHTISVTFAPVVKLGVVVTNGTATSTQAVSGGSATLTITPKPTFHTDSLFINGVFAKYLAGLTTYTVDNITPNETIRVTCTDALSKTQLDSLNTLIVGQWTMTSLNSGLVGGRDNSVLGWSVIGWDFQNIPYYCSSNVYSQYYANGVYVPNANLSGTSCSPLVGQQFQISHPNHWKLKNNGKVIYMTDWPLDSLSNITVTKDSLIAFYFAGPNSGEARIAYKYHYARVYTLTTTQIDSLVNNLSGVNFIDVLDSTYYHSGTTGRQWQAATLPPGDTVHWAFTVTSTTGGIISGTYQEIKPDNTVSLTNVTFSISPDGKMITLYNSVTKFTTYFGIVELTSTKFVYIAYNYPYGNTTTDIEFVAKRY